jgi:hypothetical protein
MGDMDFAGKIVARIEESPADPKYGTHSDDTLLIHFTDGTALRVEGSSYEEVSLSFGAESRVDIMARQRAAAGQREKKRLARLQREEWLSISCDERAARKAKARDKASSDTLVSLELREAMESLYIDHGRMLYGQGPRAIRQRCPNCGERQCENAPVKEYPADPGYAPDFSWSTFTIAVEPGSTIG